MSVAHLEGPVPPLKGLSIRTLNDARLCERIHILDRQCFPVKYSEKYYDDYVRNCSNVFSQVAFYHDILVGSIVCRIEPADAEGEFKVYIMTIGVLEPYRHLGIGSRLLQKVLWNIQTETKIRISCIMLHMKANSSVRDFYYKFNFECVEEVKDYYTGLDVCDALLLQRVIPQPHFATQQHKVKKVV